MPKPFVYCPMCSSELTEREDHEGRIRRACPNPECGWVHYDNPTPVVGAIVQRGDDVVLVRNVGWPEDWFGLVTGFLEKKEHPEAGILREIEEELGVTGEVVSFVGLHTFSMMNQIIMTYHVEVAPDAEITLNEELADMKLVPIDKLKPWPMGTGKAVKDWLASRE